MRSPDILHCSYYYGANGSIQKIITNLLQNVSKDIFQIIYHVEYGTYEDIHYCPDSQINNFIDFLNLCKPKIIHFHSNRAFSKELDIRKELNYSPNAIFHTVHGEVRSCFENLDEVICIHRDVYNLNKDLKSSIIENTVDVSSYKKYKYDIGLKNPCGSFRFSTDRISFELLDTFGSLENDIYLYGRPRYSTKTLLEIEEYKKKYKNIIFCPWSNFLESKLTDHKMFFCFYKNNKRTYCYGLNVMEAVCLGMPVVSIEREQNYQKYIDNGKNGIIVKNEEEFINVMNSLTEKDIEEMAKYSEEQCKKIKNTMPSLYENLYRKYL